MKIIIQILCFMALFTIISHAQETYSVTNKYGGVIIPRLVITNATLNQALNLLIAASPTKTAPGFIVNMTAPDSAFFTNATITLVTNNVSFINAVGCVVSQANFEMTIETNAIMLNPKKIKTK